MPEEIKKQINETLNGIGATCELLGFLRDTLIQNGFTREEAVGMATEVLIEMFGLTRGEME